MRNLILVGAGASKGASTEAGRIIPRDPPLTGKLFGQLVENYPKAWGDLPEDIHEEFDEDFEDGMKYLSEEASQLHAPLYKAMGDYFARFRLGQTQTWYDKLVNELDDSIREGETVLSSLNYDCLLEIALSRNNIPVNYFPDSLDEAGIVLKPHGSCNFISDGVQASGGVQFTEGVVFSGGIKAIDLDEVISYCRGDTGLYPSMALFRPDKHVQIGADSVSYLQDMLADAIETAQKIAIVGVKPRPSDEHIWGELTDTTGEIVYIGGQDPFDDWKGTHRPDSEDKFAGTRFHNGFEELIQSLN